MAFSEEQIKDIMEVLKKREAEIEAEVLKKIAPEYNDYIEWVDEVAIPRFFEEGRELYRQIQEEEENEKKGV